MKYLFVGDLHGDLTIAQIVIEYAGAQQCGEIIQVGDWGFIWPQADCVEQLNDILKENKQTMRFIDGNHDVHPKLFPLERNKDFNLASNLTYQHRGTLKEFPDGVRMVFLGGAPSIDKRSRVEGESWWPEEYVTMDDVAQAVQHKGPIHVLVTHDVAVKPEGFKETSDMSFIYRSRESHAHLLEVIQALKPKVNIHGHYHYRYNSQIESTKIIGLDCNFSLMNRLTYPTTTEDLL